MRLEPLVLLAAALGVGGSGLGGASLDGQVPEDERNAPQVPKLTLSPESVEVPEDERNAPKLPKLTLSPLPEDERSAPEVPKLTLSPVPEDERSAPKVPELTLSPGPEDERSAPAVPKFTLSPESVEADGKEEDLVCPMGSYQRDPVVLRCEGGRGRQMLLLNPGDSPSRSFHWRAPSGIADLRWEALLQPADGNSSAATASLTVRCSDDEEGAGDGELVVAAEGGLLNQGRVFGRFGQAYWWWGGDALEPRRQDNVLSEWFRTEGLVGCDLEVILTNTNRTTLTGSLQFEWAKVDPCPAQVPGCATCPEDACQDDEEAVCDGGSSWECVSRDEAAPVLSAARAENATLGHADRQVHVRGHRAAAPEPAAAREQRPPHEDLDAPASGVADAVPFNRTGGAPARPAANEGPLVGDAASGRSGAPAQRQEGAAAPSRERERPATTAPPSDHADAGASYDAPTLQSTLSAMLLGALSMGTAGALATICVFVHQMQENQRSEVDSTALRRNLQATHQFDRLPASEAP